MDRFVMRENIKHYLGLLQRTTDEKERARILTLLAEERATQSIDDHLSPGLPLPGKHLSGSRLGR